MPSSTVSIATFDCLPEEWRNAVVAIGNFDGMHRGHQAVLAAAQAEAEHLGAPCILLTFEPHPRSFFAPDKPLFRLTEPVMRASVASALGLNGVVVAHFDTAFAETSAEDFVRRFLIEKLQLRHAVTGYDFHFGHRRQGTPEFLQRQGVLSSFGVTVVDKHGDEEGAVSSSRIRAALEEGRVEEARQLLGWTWSVASKVVHGDRRGRDLGFPTANMVLPPSCDLRQGIYAVRYTRPDGRVHDGVASFGRRPTFDDGAPKLETFLFDFGGDLYGEMGLVSLVDWIRAEERFDSIEALVAQMNEDAAAARRILANHPLGDFDRRIAADWPRIEQEAEALGLA
ncbi:riboflavin kinase/FMN adenylyltransferase [Rhodopseudomonas julia]|uniref:Riboflavin biosynthesis protein n=1 Tax=Rhodopseudomonas julia TaxID=200617 RepID=A0ABU0C5A9_9BRAD|nr:bifunctional riboflavin kinase/FAD synthetase [Rhodopseudomonas julia]MDQ0324845.1 riboflavin kinase/FMN adenylyltransferase [Rhodopseudomonas julia]